MRDEADRLKDGDLPKDPESGTRPVSESVPRVLTVHDLLQSSAVRVMSRDVTDDTCMTGHYRLDDATGGFRSGFCWLVGADTSWGKSSWLIQVADENIKRGKVVLIVSSEDTEEVYADRLMVRRARVNATRYRDKSLKNDELARVGETADKAERVPVFIDARRWSVENLEPHIKAVIREHKVDIVAFDYIQEFKTKRRWQDERVKFREIASVLRHTAKSEKVAGILFSQLTLDGSDALPTRHNIRECRDIANASEVILIGFEPKKAIKDDNGTVVVEAGRKCMYVDKVKNGPRNMKIKMDWDAETASFQNVGHPDADRIAGIEDIAEDDRYWDN